MHERTRRGRTQKEHTNRDKKPVHSDEEKSLPQHDGDSVQTKNADVPSRSSQTISIMLKKLPSCSQVVPFAIKNREGKHDVMSNHRLKESFATPSDGHAQTSKRATPEQGETMSERDDDSRALSDVATVSRLTTPLKDFGLDPEKSETVDAPKWKIFV